MELVKYAELIFGYTHAHSGQKNPSMQLEVVIHEGPDATSKTVRAHKDRNMHSSFSPIYMPFGTFRNWARGVSLISTPTVSPKWM